jgi:hypothetical protein
MTAGLQSDTTSSRYTTIRLLDANAGTSSIPAEAAAATALKAVPTATEFFDLSLIGLPAGVLNADWEIFVWNTAGTDAVACTVRLWAYKIPVSGTAGTVFPWGVGTGANKGKINEFNSIDTSDTDKVRHWERIPGPGMVDGIMAQITASAGTGTEAWTVDVRCPKNATRS